MTRNILSISFFLVLSLVVGFLLSGNDQVVDWFIAGGLFGLALVGEALRFWLRRSRAKARQSSGT